MELMSVAPTFMKPALALPLSARARASRGFTLIELMIVVVVIGILSSFAIPYFQRANARARRTELNVVLEKLHTYFINQYESNNTFVAPSSGCPIPLGNTSCFSAWNPDPGAAATGQPANWSNTRTGWNQIPFAFDGGLKLRYQYGITADPSGATPGSMTIVAVGDMPGLGSKFTVVGGGGAGNVMGNYQYTEVITGTYIAPAVELPSNF
jgi:prepilin-type N-terminal cleavage/methylation domain-containing protein